MSIQEQENRKQFYLLLNEGTELIKKHEFDEGIAKLKEAQLYTSAETPLATELDDWLRLATNLKDLLPTSVDVLPK